MEGLNCAGSNACKQYCEALLMQGVAVDFEAGCNVPAMFSVTDKGIDFDPTHNEAGIQNPDLINTLGGALCGTLIERTALDPERQFVDRLITQYDTVFSARTNMWGAMLGAAREKRTFTDAELTYYQDQLEQTTEALDTAAASTSQEARLRAQAAYDHATLAKYGVLFDEPMIKAVDRLVSNLMDGKPTLGVGDKGIAKTQVEKYVARLWDPENEPIIISGHGDMMSNELIGQMEQDKDTRVFAFKEGKLLKAMREGRPVILDEINIGDQPVMMRLQDIALRRPGDKVIIQENGLDPIEIQPGFVIMATANEASARYQHRNVLDPAFRDRFDVLQFQYPDVTAKNNPIQEIPRSLMRLALAGAVDERGVLSSHITATDLEKLVRLAYVTQHLYSIPARDSKVNLDKGNASTSGFLDEEPVMTDCITPRSVYDTITRCAAGNKPGMTLTSELERLIIGLDQSGSKHNQTHARSVLALLRTK
jgi:hypothetical protein